MPNSSTKRKRSFIDAYRKWQGAVDHSAILSLENITIHDLVEGRANIAFDKLKQRIIGHKFQH